MFDDYDFKRTLMDETVVKLDHYVRSLVKKKKDKQAQAFCETKYPQIAHTGFVKRIISALIEQSAESNTNIFASLQNVYDFVRDRLLGKLEVTMQPSETKQLDTIVINVGEGVSLNLRMGNYSSFEVSVCVPPTNVDSSKSNLTDPNMPNGKEEAAPLMFPCERLGAFCLAAEYVFDNAEELKGWVTDEYKDLWEYYKYIDYPKKDVYDKVPEYWWWAWLDNASAKDLSDLKFVKKLITHRGECLAKASPASKADRATVLAAIKNFSYAITYASEDLQNDRNFILQAIDSNGSVFQYIDDKFKCDRKIALRAVKKKGGNLEYVSERLKGDSQLVDIALEHDMYNLQYASKAFRENIEYIIRAVSERGELLEVLSESFRADRQVVLSAVMSNGAALEFASEELRDDREIVLAAVENDCAALEFASEGLRDDREIVLAAVENDCAALKHASDKLRDDKEVALYALSKGREAWYFISKRLLFDFDIIKAAASVGGYDNLEILPKEMLKNPDTVISILTILAENSPSIEDYAEFDDGTSEYYTVFENAEKTFCKLVKGLTVKTLKSDTELMAKICELAALLDSTYYDEGTNPYEHSHTRLPDQLKEYFEKNCIPYSEAITKAIVEREARKYHPKDYGEDIPLEESLFLEAGDYYEWFAKKIRDKDGQDAFTQYLGSGGNWVCHVMERFVKSLVANWEGLFHDDELWYDEDYEVDLDKTYEEINKRLSSKMEVERNAFEFYYSENVKVRVNEKVLFELVRECPLKVIELWVNDYNTDCERGFWVAPDRLDIFCDMAEYIQDNYQAFEKKAKERAASIKACLLGSFCR